MKLRKLTATFGCLDGATLTFGPGLTLIGAPNGSGKSTWCAFLRVMLYGLDTRQRDRKGAPADKNRYRPWNGKPMEGLLECEHQGAVILLRRTSAGGVPMGDFSAVYQATGLPVPGLTADNAGEVLTGLSREVFDRSVFLRQTALAVTQSQDLEKRITDLVSSGEEDVSWSEANDRLKAWLHRRRFHKSGRIPLLEAEAAQLRQTVAQTAALRQDLAQQQARAATLRRQADHWDKRLSAETDKFQTVSQQRYAQAAAELDAAQLHLQTLQAQQQAQPHIPHPGLKSRVGGVQAAQIIALGPAHMRGAVTGFVIGVLINQHRAHVRGLKNRILLGLQRPHIHVDPADLAHAVKNGIEHADGFFQIFHFRIGQLATDQNDPLVALADQLAPGFAHFRRGHVFARHRRVAAAVGAVQALAAAVIGNVQRRGKHDTVAVNLLLDLIRRVHQQNQVLGVADPHQRGGLLNAQGLQSQRFVQNIPQLGIVRRAFAAQSLVDCLMIQPGGQRIRGHADHPCRQK